MDIKRELEDLEIKLEKARTEQSKLEGRKEELLNSLKQEYNVENEDEIETLLIDLKNKKEKIEEKLNERFTNFKSKYPELFTN